MIEHLVSNGVARGGKKNWLSIDFSSNAKLLDRASGRDGDQALAEAAYIAK